MRKLLFLLLVCTLLSQLSQAQWVKVTNGMGNSKFIYSLATNEKYIFAGTSKSGVYKSSDNGTSWIQTSFRNQTVEA